MIIYFDCIDETFSNRKDNLLGVVYSQKIKTNKTFSRFVEDYRLARLNRNSITDSIEWAKKPERK